MAGIEIRLLGPFEISHHGVPMSLTGNRLRTLLGVLAMAAGDTVATTVIGSALWGPVASGAVNGRVRTSVTRLRRVLGDDTLPAATTGYRLNIDPDAVDALRFQRLCQEVAAAAGTEDERKLVNAALSLWRGQPFDGIRSDWLVQTYTPDLTEHYLQVLERRIDLDLGDDRAGGDDLVAELSGLVEQYPLRQSLWARLLVALQRRGRPAEALQHYETVRRRLADVSGVAPGPELQGLHAALLAADRGTPRAFPRQVPSDVERFVGRVEQLRELDQFDRHVAVVHGSAGIGKTALVVHWAWRVADRFPDGQVFVPLRGYGPGEAMTVTEALDVMLNGLGFRGERIPAGIDARRKLLREALADRQVLIVLDNARDAEHVRPLVPASGTVVITSRSQLRELSTHRICLNLLPPDEAEALLAYRLRRQKVAYDDDSLVTLADLCGHLPLALTIAAERAGRDSYRPLAGLVRQLRDERERLDVLETGQDLSSSLRAVMSWSCRALDADAARVFRQLGLYPGADIGIPAAAALAGISRSDASTLLDRLSDASLLISSGDGRFAMHDLVRMYAAEQALQESAAEREHALRRLHEWYALSAAAAHSAIASKHPVDATDPERQREGLEPLSFDDERQAMLWFDAEQHVLPAVITGMRQVGRHREVCQLIRAVCQYYMHVSRVPAEITALHELALQSARLAGDKLAEAQVLNQLGVIHCRPGEFESALPRFEAAYELYQQLEDAGGAVSALGNVGFVQWHLGNHAAAIDHLERAIDRGRHHGGGVRLASALTNIAEVYTEIGRHGEAEASVTEAIDLARAAGKRLEEAFALDTLAKVQEARGDHSRATDLLRRTADIFREADSRWDLAWVLRNLGQAQRNGGDPTAARASWEEALHILDETGIEDSDELSRTELRNHLATLT